MIHRIATVSVFTIVLFCWCRQVCSKKLTLESFEQTVGEDVMWLDLRVRKYNRTSSVINGTIHLFVDGTNDYKFQLDLFYSRLGNQQFNHVPMKLPTAGICDFMDHIYTSYPKEMQFLVNGPEIGECPINRRTMYIFDQEFPTEAIPDRLLRNGLWKALVRCHLYGKEIINYSIVLKASDN
ncbi:uncharacterized protein LOC118510095 [Anopheles stephensi]|uniref:uncharacterized protein LOC118510095 n=1 Tax=Anopheles stephensi TaxID=30069 RepID=UPI001658ABA0|nr:uncharacterized protein LOC118510095 [Anopheles stephensi]